MKRWKERERNRPLRNGEVSGPEREVETDEEALCKHALPYPLGSLPSLAYGFLRALVCKLYAS